MGGTSLRISGLLVATMRTCTAPMHAPCMPAGQRAHELPKQIASVWKHGWQLRPRSDDERAALEALLAQAPAQSQEQSPPQEGQQ